MVMKKKYICVLIFLISLTCSADRSVQKNTEFTEITTTVLDETSGFAYLPNVIEPFTGKYMKYYSSGKKESESSYKDGKKNGLMIGWFENGQKKFVMSFKDGKEVSGSTTEWLKNEQEVYEVINNMNERTATVIVETNKIVYLPNEPEPFTGKYDGYYSSGKKKFETNYKDGKKNGLETFWSENGQKWFEGNFKNGKQNGLITAWGENGQKLKETNYKDGKKNGLETFWYENGQKMTVENYKDGKQDGLVTAWGENGQKLKETNYKDGKKNGLETFWSENGQKMTVENYKDGKQNGLDTSWHENRQKYAEADSSAKNRNVPMESLGLSLGAPFTLTECPFDSPNSTNYKPRYDLIKENQLPCWEHYSYSSQPGPLSAEAETVWLVVSEVPLGINKESILATVLKGNLEKLVISTFGFDAQEVVLSKLVSKYGKPSEISASKEQNRIGASFENITAIWNFPNLSVAFFGMDINTVHGNIDIQTPQATAYIEQLNRQKTAMEPKL